MATISGRVYYSPSSYNNATDGVTLLDNNKVCLLARAYLPNIPIVLVNAYGQGICILTDSSGNYKFEQIPTGKYKIIEAFGRTDGIASPFSYSNSSFTNLDNVMAKDPTIHYIDSLGLHLNNGNAIISITPNTFIVNITSNGDNKSFDFMDAPVINIPLTLSNYKRIGNNLITVADNGTFGTFPKGTPAGTSLDSEPEGYSDITQFQYIKYSSNSPNGGYYSLCNILNLNTFNNVWHNCTNHSSGDETGIAMIVNNDNPSHYFFIETISNLNPSNKYLFTAWFMNLYRFTGYVAPAFKLLIISSKNRILAEETVKTEYYATTIPTWEEIGVSVDLKNLNSDEIENDTASVTFKMISLAKEALGNDFLVDDISVTQIIESKPKMIKSSSKSIYSINEEIDYTSTFTNNSESSLSELIFKDSLPYGTNLVDINATGENFTILVNGFKKNIIITKSQLSEGINISDILINSNIPNTIPNYTELNNGLIPEDISITFSFSIKIINFDLLDSKPLIYNYSECNYINNSNLFSESAISNISKVTILYPEITVQKKLSKIIQGNEIDFENISSLLNNEDFIYKIIITNTGTSEVNNIIIEDNINKLILPLYSTNSDCIGITKQITSPELNSVINVLCNEITKEEDNINNIKISNITVPAANITIVNDKKVVTPGITIVRIHCRVKI